MPRLRPALACLALLCACATSTSSGPPKAPGSQAAPVAAKVALTNVIPFDVAACGPRALTLAPLNGEVLMGALLSMGPATQECFVAPGSRDGRPFDLQAEVTVTDGTVAIDVVGTGASAEGLACVKAALAKLPLLSGSATAQVPLSTAPQVVKLGDDAPNDAAGALRLALPGACACFASLSGAPPSLEAEVEVSAAGATVALTPAGPLADCLAPRLTAALPKAPVKLRWPVLLKHSYGEVDAGASAALRFQQLDGLRGQRTADVLLAAGQRAAAASTYDELGARYKKKPGKGMLAELEARCAAVVAADDAWLAALRRLVDVFDASAKLALAEKANDAQWAQVEGPLAQQLTTTTAEVVRVEAQKRNDQAACPKASSR